MCTCIYGGSRQTYTITSSWRIEAFNPGPPTYYTWTYYIQVQILLYIYNQILLFRVFGPGVIGGVKCFNTHSRNERNTLYSSKHHQNKPSRVLCHDSSRFGHVGTEVLRSWISNLCYLAYVQQWISIGL